MKKLLSVFLSILLGGSSPALAGGYCGVAAVRQSYNYGYNYYNQQLIAQPIVIGVPVAGIYGTQFFYSVGQELREDRIAETAANKIVDKLDKSGYIIRGSNGAPVVPNPVPTPVPPPLPNPPSTGSDGQVLDLFRKKCSTCHKNGSAKPGNITLFDTAGNLFADANTGNEMKRRFNILDAVIGGPNVTRMPQEPNDPLSDTEVELVRSWTREFSTK